MPEREIIWSECQAKRQEIEVSGNYCVINCDPIPDKNGCYKIRREQSKRNNVTKAHMALKRCHRKHERA